MTSEESTVSVVSACFPPNIIINTNCLSTLTFYSFSLRERKRSEFILAYTHGEPTKIALQTTPGELHRFSLNASRARRGPRRPPPATRSRAPPAPPAAPAPPGHRVRVRVRVRAGVRVSVRVRVGLGSGLGLGLGSGLGLGLGLGLASARLLGLPGLPRLGLPGPRVAHETAVQLAPQHLEQQRSLGR